MFYWHELRQLVYSLHVYFHPVVASLVSVALGKTQLLASTFNFKTCYTCPAYWTIMAIWKKGLGSELVSRFGDQTYNTDLLVMSLDLKFDHLN